MKTHTSKNSAVWVKTFSINTKRKLIKISFHRLICIKNTYYNILDEPAVPAIQNLYKIIQSTYILHLYYNVCIWSFMGCVSLKSYQCIDSIYYIHYVQSVIIFFFFLLFYPPKLIQTHDYVYQRYKEQTTHICY